ncbi:helix-turn-helix domain-containing protein, partial [Pantoea sp.]|uniref:helix-turn-helix domain-containing protein n=1 Tax=Pantoea sp. TaxID=69393 RepID=UPI0028A90543
MNSFTKDLVSWIENNLDNNIFLDKVSEKSGYSKWHLQRIFKAETKINLASYVRQRRLSKAAIMLKMTSVLVCDISDYLGFSTQQTFTRTFTRHFGIAPGKYRMQEDWHFQGITSDLRLEKKSDLVPELVFLGT